MFKYIQAQQQLYRPQLLTCAQWGTLLAMFGVFRLFTYVLLYLSPLTSYYPSRPPTEIIGSFCLMAGGLVFMASVSLSPGGSDLRF